jgi:hypothetical protein
VFAMDLKDVERCFQMEHDEMPRRCDGLAAIKTDEKRQYDNENNVCEMGRGKARAIHRRHKSSLRNKRRRAAKSVCKPSKKISFKFFTFFLLLQSYFNSFSSCLFVFISTEAIIVVVVLLFLLLCFCYVCKLK